MASRLDKALVARGLTDSRNRAQKHIEDSEVFVNGSLETKASKKVGDGDDIELHLVRERWVSRSGEKLAHAFDVWHVDVSNKVCLDVGASTGGFTEVLLSHGAKKVYAVDVGHDQLHRTLREDPRVISREGVHIKDVSKDTFCDDIECIVIDVSFISLKQVLPIAVSLLAPGGTCVALIKPQFEVGKHGTKKGVVTSDADRSRVVSDIVAFASELGLADIRTEPSPIIGEKGNMEILLYGKRV